MMTHRLFALVLTASLSLPALAQELQPTTPPAARQAAEPTLAIGDPAPALDVRGFLIADAVEAHGPGPIRVVVFWSTVCLSCRAALPDIAAAARRYADADVRFLGVVNELPDQVENFILTTPWGPLLTYPVAIDRANSTTESYLHAVNRRALPIAFIIGRDGTIEWFGIAADLDAPLAAVVAGTWDRAVGAAAIERRREFDRTHSRMGVQFVRAVNAEEWETVLELIERLEAVDPTATSAPTERLRVLLARLGRVEEANALARDLLRRFPREAPVLHRTARLLLQTQHDGPRDTALAFEIAYRASEQMLHEHWSYLATLATAHEANGRLDEAIQTMVAAIDRTTARIARDSLGEVLGQWQMRLATGDTRPARTPLRDLPTDDEP